MVRLHASRPEPCILYTRGRRGRVTLGATHAPFGRNLILVSQSSGPRSWSGVGGMEKNGDALRNDATSEQSFTRRSIARAQVSDAADPYEYSLAAAPPL